MYCFNRNAAAAATAATIAVSVSLFAGFAGTPVAIADEPNYGETGALTVGWTRVKVDRDSGARFDSRVYYPATGTTFDAPFDPSEGPYPVVVFGHGYLTDPAEYIGTYQHLASWGYIVMAPESALGLFPNHQKFANDLR
ncbi:MAG: chlorophyllase/cutinase-like alpha/beta fold protein, partial [Planctomycetota bacterium]